MLMLGLVQSGIQVNRFMRDLPVNIQESADGISIPIPLNIDSEHGKAIIFGKGRCQAELHAAAT